VLAVALQKGGVAKTTTAVNLGAALAELGLRVLLVDVDQQANLTQQLGVDPDESPVTMWEVLAREREYRRDLADAVTSTAFGVDLVPGSTALRQFERNGLGPGGAGRFRRALHDVATAYDVVLIDCPPSLGELTTAGLEAADRVLATVAPGSAELAALAELEQTVADIRDGSNPTLTIGFVVVTRFDGRNRLGRQTRAMLREDWPEEYVGEVAQTVKVGEAVDRAEPVLRWAPGSAVAEDYRLVAAEVKRRIST
jgi:chromosome partitioning protein